MSTTKANATVRIELTPDQIGKIEAEIGKSVTTIELTVQELEVRITPMLAANHNETMLVE